MTTNKTTTYMRTTASRSYLLLNACIERDKKHKQLRKTIEHQREKLPPQHFCAGYERNLAIISISLVFASLENNPLYFSALQHLIAYKLSHLSTNHSMYRVYCGATKMCHYPERSPFCNWDSDVFAMCLFNILWHLVKDRYHIYLNKSKYFKFYQQWAKKTKAFFF